MSMKKKRVYRTRGSASDMKRYIRQIRWRGIAGPVFARANHRAGVKLTYFHYSRLKHTTEVVNPFVYWDLK